ncbi:hypothetical protein H9W91_07235 [Streptomyces alfalfae]|uniref:phage terminase small subunit n=1 Tax=Streptomyces alfalfae TaxID=1642299 RepID=UPI001BAA0565|nr:hypothetical protein [Streptomyces alfalfae]QUI30674.1 hypothetical protein H9W91_07235 [Streptomyces alfalfae]
MTRGPKPKPNAVRRNKHEHAQALKDEAQEGRELPRALGIQTSGAKRFWRTWATAPQTATWAETDWAELEITTKLVDAFYQGDTKHASEIRMRTAKWGGTVEDRARLRMSIESEDEEAEEGPDIPSDDQMDEELFKLLNNS